MKILALLEAASLLKVTPKSVGNWAKEAGMTLHPHPTDARSKCLTLEQVEQLANLHGRILHLDLLGTLPLIETNDFDERSTENTTQVFLQEEAELRRSLFQLEKTVENQQWQIAQLALILLQEPIQRTQQQQEMLKDLIKMGGKENLLENPILTERPMHPAELRARAYEIPQVIYSKDSDTYFIIRPGEGNFSIPPDTLEWFDWLATLSSFRFVGKEGRFTASRVQAKKNKTRSWTAQRTVNKKNTRKYLGLTEKLTIDHLEKAAAILTSRLKD